MDSQTFLKDYLEMLLQEGCPMNMAERRKLNGRFYMSKGLRNKSSGYRSTLKKMANFYIALESNKVPRSVRQDAGLMAMYLQVLDDYKQKYPSTKPIKEESNMDLSADEPKNWFEEWVLKLEEEQQQLMRTDKDAEKEAEKYNKTLEDARRQVNEASEKLGEAKALQEKANRIMDKNEEESQRLEDMFSLEEFQMLQQRQTVLTFDPEKEEMKKVISGLEKELAQLRSDIAAKAALLAIIASKDRQMAQQRQKLLVIDVEKEEQTKNTISDLETKVAQLHSLCTAQETKIRHYEDCLQDKNRIIQDKERIICLLDAREECRINCASQQ